MLQRLIEIIVLHRQSRQAAQRVERIGIGRQHRFEGLGGALVVAHVPAADAQVQLRLGPVGPLGDAGLEGFGAAAIVAAFQAQVAQPEPDVFQIRVLGENARVDALGFFFGALLVQHGRQIVQHLEQIGRDFERLLIGGARLRQVAGFLMDDAQIHVGLAGVRTDADRFRISFGGLLQVCRSSAARRPD